jgi:hypothetical protein
MKDNGCDILCQAVNILNLYLFATQHFSSVTFSKQYVETLSCTFIPRSDVGNTSTDKTWTNIPTAVEQYCGCDECYLWRLRKFSGSGSICWRVPVYGRSIHRCLLIIFQYSPVHVGLISAISLKVSTVQAYTVCSWGYQKLDCCYIL